LVNTFFRGWRNKIYICLTKTWIYKKQCSFLSAMLKFVCDCTNFDNVARTNSNYIIIFGITIYQLIIHIVYLMNSPLRQYNNKVKYWDIYVRFLIKRFHCKILHVTNDTANRNLKYDTNCFIIFLNVLWLVSQHDLSFHLQDTLLIIPFPKFSISSKHFPFYLKENLYF